MRNLRIPQVFTLIHLIYQQTNELRGCKKEKGERNTSFSNSVPRPGVEPGWMLLHWCLRPARLPIPPSGLVRYFCRNEATRTPDPYVPNVVRYQLRYIPISSF